MILPADIETLDNFKRRTKRQIARLRQTGRPAVLTVNGKPAVVVQDAAAYQEQMEAFMELDVIKAVRQGADDADAGRVENAKSFFKRLRRERSKRT